MTSRAASPGSSTNKTRSPKRIKLESAQTTLTVDHNDTLEAVDEDHCSICLQHLVDRTVLPICAHEFCFECIFVWTEQSRRCPLCSQAITEYLIHHIRSKYDYQKHYLTPLRTSHPPLPPAASSQQSRRRRREHQWGRRSRRDFEEQEEADELERAIAKRRWIYEHGLYAKHVASNSFTRYRPYPTPAQFSSSQDLISRTTMFLRRELRVWVNLDVEFLTTFILSLMKSIDIRSESAVKLLAEFLDMDMDIVEGDRSERRNAEHFAHEVYCYLRSPYRDLSVYDSVVQYDTPENLPAPIELERSRRWRPSRSRSRSRSRSKSRSRSRSHSPYRRDLPLSVDPRPRTRSESASSRPRRKSHQESREKRRHTGRRDASSSRRSRSRSRSRNRRKSGRDRRANHSEPALDHVKGKGKGRQRMDIPKSTRSQSPQAVTLERRGTTEKASQGVEMSLVPEEDRPLTSNHLHAKSSVANASTVTGNTQSASKTKPRPPRNRGLLESVQAHLSGGRTKAERCVNTREKANADDKGKDKNISLVADGISPSSEAGPSSIAHLSNSNLTPSSGQDDQEAPPPPALNIDKELPRPRLSAPQIMARTRARLAKLKDELVADVTSSADLDAHGTNDTHDTTRVSSTDQIRARLLNRLQEERQRIPQAPSDPARSAADINFGVGFDSQAAEAKLRMQAQVRVRLAAAKRAAGGHSASVSTGKYATVDIVRIEEDTAFVQREESLRARLRNRQI